MVHAERVGRHGEGVGDQVGGAGCGTAGSDGLGNLSMGDGDGRQRISFFFVWILGGFFLNERWR